MNHSRPSQGDGPRKITRHWCAACGERVTLRDSYAHPTRQGGADRYCPTCGDPRDVTWEVSDADGVDPWCPAIGPADGGAQAAAALAIARAMSHGRAVHIDTLCGTRAAADALGLLESYDEDPDASVTDRIVVRAESIGRIA